MPELVEMRQVTPDRPVSDLESWATSLVQIYDDKNPKLQRLLVEWEKRVDFATSRIERKETLSFHVKNEIYQLGGFFIVFQGVILTSVSQSNNLRCENWWSPFSLSAIATVVTLGGVVLKSFDYVKWRNGVRKLQSDVKVLRAQIALLKQYGEKFDFEKHIYTPPNKLSSTRPRSLKDRVIFGTFVFLVVALISFAAVVLLSCRAILCVQ